MTPNALVLQVLFINILLKSRFYFQPLRHIHMLCTLVVFAAGAIASNGGSEISIDGNTIFANNTADRYGGETKRMPGRHSPVSTPTVAGKANHIRVATLQVADHSI